MTRYTGLATLPERQGMKDTGPLKILLFTTRQIIWSQKPRPDHYLECVGKDQDTYKNSVENGSLDASINLRFPNSDYGTRHISFYAYGIGIDDTCLAHLIAFVQDVTEAYGSLI